MKALRHSLVKRNGMFVLAGLVIAILLVVVACGEEATPTPVPATATPVPATSTPLPPGVTPPPATATPVPPTATPAPPTGGPRPLSEWTEENPGTMEEVAAELEKHRGEKLIWYEWGGVYNGVTEAGWLTPITDRFGIEILLDSPVQYAKVRAAAETGNLQWHIGNGSGQASWSLGVDGALEELDFSIIDVRDYDPLVTAPWFFPGYAWTNAIAYSTETYPNGLNSMADFFDVDRVPGRRMVASPGWSWKTTLRFALLSENPSLLETAAGKATLAQMDDAQLARAFEIMEEFRPNISAWWTGGADAPSLIISGEIDMSTSWASGIGNAIKEGAPLELCWNCGHLLATEPYWVVKGWKEQDPNAYELANLVLAWINFPENFVNVMEYIAWGPVNPGAIMLMGDPRFDENRPYVPTSPNNVIYGIWGDQKFDGENTSRIGEMWDEFTAGG